MYNGRTDLFQKKKIANSFIRFFYASRKIPYQFPFQFIYFVLLPTTCNIYFEIW